MDIEIKPLTESEWEKHKELRLEALKNELLAFGSSYDESNLMSEENWRARTHDNVLFAMLNSTPKGMLAIIFNSRIKNRHIAEIHGMYVAKDVRGLGIGSKLMDAALSKIKENKNIKKIKIEVNSIQEPAIRLYQKNGFEIAGRLMKELFVDDKFYDNFCMELFIV